MIALGYTPPELRIDQVEATCDYLDHSYRWPEPERSRLRDEDAIAEAYLEAKRSYYEGDID